MTFVFRLLKVKHDGNHTNRRKKQIENEIFGWIKMWSKFLLTYSFVYLLNTYVFIDFGEGER